MMESHLMFFLILSSSLHSIQCPVDLLTALHLLPPPPTSSMDFGRTTFNSPYAVLSPISPTDISLLLTTLSSSPSHGLTVAARGAGHSVHGQAQALDGIVVEMDALRTTIKIHRDGETGFAYADASGGTLWVELLEESLKEGLTPRSWTDYLYLTIGGTLSNGGISGQTFKYGPQISNVLQLEVITGTGEIVTCSATHDQELFHAVLGGLGQFGIITSARIILQDAPQKVRWIRAFYEDFGTFIGDQELLVSMPQLLDYVEGFMVLNERSLHSSFMDLIPIHHTQGNRIYYCLEFAVHVYQDQDSHVDSVVEEIEARLRCIQHYIYRAEVPYYDFLNRVRMEEMSLRGKGLWDIPHPWLNMFVPKTGIMKFKDLLLENISTEDFVGHILIYPILRNKWDVNSSVVLPESSDDVMYIVGVLQSADPRSCSPQCLEGLLLKNRYLTRTAGSRSIGAKQYLGNQDGPTGWKQHFGSKWARFVHHKSRFDPHNLLSPGQGIFTYGIGGRSDH